MKFTMTFDMDNAAFQDADASHNWRHDCADEVARVFERVQARVKEALLVEDSGYYGGVDDSNGNRIGRWKIEDTDD